MKPEDRISSMEIQIPREGGDIRTHLYSRYVGDGTEIWFFGTGLGDQACMAQIGDCFLSMVEEGKDPKLGRIMFSLGKSLTSFMPYRGDHNIVWAWGLQADELEEYLNKFQVKPEWVLSPYDEILDKSEELGLHKMKWWSGVNPRFFKPLKGKVPKPKKYGYAGLPKSRKQQEIVLKPAMEKGELEWITKDPTTKFLPIVELNKWYNSKRILFGMVDEERHNMTFVPTRFFETIASGTPFITYKINGVYKHSGIRYPYMTTSAEETAELIDKIEGNYYDIRKRFRKWSKHIREKHSYKVRLTDLFEKLGGET